MEIVKVQLARSIWLFDTQELNPRGLTLYPEIYAAFSNRYQFATLPKPEEIHSGGSIYFKHGKFVYDDLTRVEVDFDLHGDGLVATTRHSTEAANAFLQDCVSWLSEQLVAKYPPDLTKKRIYRSELIVHMASRLDTVSEKAQRFAESISEVSKKSVQVIGITFGSEDPRVLLTVERRINVPFEEERYFSAAALQTAQHFDLLRDFERMMAE